MYVFVMATILPGQHGRGTARSIRGIDVQPAAALETYKQIYVVNTEKRVLCFRFSRVRAPSSDVNKLWNVRCCAEFFIALPGGVHLEGPHQEGE